MHTLNPITSGLTYVRKVKLRVSVNVKATTGAGRVLS